MITLVVTSVDYTQLAEIPSSGNLCLILLPCRNRKANALGRRSRHRANDYPHRCDTARKHTLPHRTHPYEDSSVSGGFTLALSRHTLHFCLLIVHWYSPFRGHLPSAVWHCLLLQQGYKGIFGDIEEFFCAETSYRIIWSHCPKEPVMLSARPEDKAFPLQKLFSGRK